MIVHNLNAIRPRLRPDEANAPFIVDANAELSRTVTFQGFKAIPRRGPQCVEGRRRVQHVQLARKNLVESEPGWTVAFSKERLRLSAGEVDNHAGRYTLRIAYYPALSVHA